MACHHTHVVARLEEERDWLDHAIAACDWRFAQLSVLEHRRAVITWVLGLLRDEAAA